MISLFSAKNEAFETDHNFLYFESRMFFIYLYLYLAQAFFIFIIDVGGKWWWWWIFYIGIWWTGRWPISCCNRSRLHFFNLNKKLPSNYNNESNDHVWWFGSGSRCLLTSSGGGDVYACWAFDTTADLGGAAFATLFKPSGNGTTIAKRA